MRRMLPEFPSVHTRSCFVTATLCINWKILLFLVIPSTWYWPSRMVILSNPPCVPIQMLLSASQVRYEIKLSVRPSCSVKCFFNIIEVSVVSKQNNPWYRVPTHNRLLVSTVIDLPLMYEVSDLKWCSRTKNCEGLSVWR